MELKFTLPRGNNWPTWS